MSVLPSTTLSLADRPGPYSGPSLSGPHLSGPHLSGTQLSGTHLSGVAFPGAAAIGATPTAAELEFDRQVDALVQAGVPALLDARDDCFRAMVEPLRDLLPEDDGSGGIPFVVAVPHVPVTEVLAAVHTAGGTGRTGLSAEELAALRPLPELGLPTTPYLIVDVDPGTATRDMAPGEAAASLRSGGRSPLTLSEGLAVLVCDCGLLRAGTSFALPGSRADDGRLPALWTSGPWPTLGWCDGGSPQPGLGSASCRRRLTA